MAPRKSTALAAAVMAAVVTGAAATRPLAAEPAGLALPLQADARAEDAMQLEFDPAATANRNLQGYMGFRRLQMATTDADEAMGLDFDAAATAKRNLQGYMGF